MIFWILAIIVSLAALRIGYMTGFRKAWPITFNILVSVYFGIMTTGIFGKLYPEFGQYQYIKVLLILGLTAVCFILLHCIIFFLVDENFIKKLPVLFDDIAGATLGLVSGFAICSLVALIIFMSILDIKAISKVSENYFGKQAKASVKFCCGFVEGISLQSCENQGMLEETISWLVKDQPKEEQPVHTENLADKDMDTNNNLEELLDAGYIKAMPMDPFSDKPLVYRKTKENFILYSVGQKFHRRWRTNGHKQKHWQSKIMNC